MTGELTGGAAPENPGASDPWERAQAACGRAVALLTDSGVAPEELAQFTPERRVRLGPIPLWRKPASMQRLGTAWRLGTLLLGADGALYAHGHSTRAAERGRPSFQSESREERREIAAAALRGGFDIGTAVNFDAVLLLSGEGLPGAGLLGVDPDPSAAGAERSGRKSTGPESPVPAASARELPVGLAEGEVRVRWRVGAPLSGAQTLEGFLAERVELLVNPPFARD